MLCHAPQRCQIQILTRAKVLKFGDDSPYSVQATLEWNSLEDFQKAASDQDALNTIMGDVKNFSNTTPKLMTGEIVGSQ